MGGNENSDKNHLEFSWAPKSLGTMTVATKSKGTRLHPPADGHLNIPEPKAVPEHEPSHHRAQDAAAHTSVKAPDLPELHCQRQRPSFDHQ